MADYGIQTTPTGDPGGPGMDHTHRPDAAMATVAAMDRRVTLDGQIAPQGGTTGCPMTMGDGY